MLSTIRCTRAGPVLQIRHAFLTAPVEVCAGPNDPVVLAVEVLRRHHGRVLIELPRSSVDGRRFIWAHYEDLVTE